MTSAKSWTKSRGTSLYLHTLRSSIGLMVAFFLLLTLTGPLPFITNSLSVLAQLRQGGNLAVNSGSSYASQYTQENFFGFVCIALIGALVIGLITTSFMHNRRAVDLYGALPVRRETLLLAKALAGITVILIPYILSTALLFIAQAVLQAYETTTLLWLVNFGSFAIYAVGVYIITVFCAVNTGAVFDTAMFTIALCGAPSILLFLNDAMVSLTLIGYQSTGSMNTFILGISPVASPVVRLFESTYVNQLESGSYMVRSFVFWPLAMALLLCGALLLFKKRRSEIAGTSKPSGTLQLIIKLMAANITGVLVAMLFIETLGNTWLMATLGLLIGAFVAYFIAEAVLARGFKTFKRMLLQFAVVAGVVLAGTAILYTGAFGYSTRVPSADEVESAEISYRGVDNYSFKYMPYYEARDNRFTEPEVIRQIVLAHQGIVNSASFGRINVNRYGRNEASDLLNSSTQITYTLKNGQTVSRSFASTPADAREAIYNLNSLTAFRTKNSIIFSLRPQDIASISRTDMTFAQEQPITPLSQEQAARLCEALKADEAAQTYDQVMSPSSRELFTLMINFSYLYEDPSGVSNMTQETVTLPVQPWHQNTIAALRGFGWEVNETPDYSAIGGAYLLGSENRSWKIEGMYASEAAGGLIQTPDGAGSIYDLLVRYAGYDKEAYPAMPATDNQPLEMPALDYLLKSRITDKAQIAQLAQACVKRYNAQPGERVYTVAFELLAESDPSVNNGVSSLVACYLLPESKAPEFIKNILLLGSDASDGQTATAGDTQAATFDKEQAVKEKMAAVQAAGKQ